MSKYKQDFNTKIENVKLKILDECKLFKSNFEEFLTVGELLISSDHIDKATKQQCKDFIDELNEGHMRIIFCGQVKSGKSRCIIEFLSGKLKLPSCGIPTTTFFTRIFYSHDPQIYMEKSGQESVFYSFDGKNVPNNLVGRKDDSEIYDIDLEVVYHVGTPYAFPQENFIVIDTPGLNETKNITEAFFKNLSRFNPQLIVYIYDAGPGFTVSDQLLCTNIITHARKDLKKIFLFNKYDKAFEAEKTFVDEDDIEEEDIDIENERDDEEDDDSDEDSGEDNTQKHQDLYKIDYEKHYNKLRDFFSDNSKWVLIGYSSKLVQNLRLLKENKIPFLLHKHVDFFSKIQTQINSVNMETLETIFLFTENFLFKKLKLVYYQILKTKDKDFLRFELEEVAKEKLFAKFDESHAKIKVSKPQINQVELDNTINEIIKNQEKQISLEPIKSKLEKISNALINFFINRHINLFSNIIQSKIDCISFSSLRDEIKNNDLESFFSHTFCTLMHEEDNYNLHSAIELHFQNQLNQLNKSSSHLQGNSFQITENYKAYFKTNLKYGVEHILPKIEDYIKVKLRAERQLLESAIDKKKNEIIKDFEMTEQETTQQIKECIAIFKKWIFFNNNYLTAVRNSFEISNELKNLIDNIKNRTEIREGIIQVSFDSFVICKKESVDFNEVSCQNCDIIQYFLRVQYISRYQLKSFMFYDDKTKNLFLITENSDFQPLRSVLPILTDSQKKSILLKLIEILENLNDHRLPLDNLGPDMIFCKIISDYEVDIQITETTQHFHEWKYTLENGNPCDNIFFKYPHYKSNISIGESIVSMFHSFGWIMLIILHGKCDKIIKSSLLNKAYKPELVNIFENNQLNKMYVTSKSIIEKSLKQPFETKAVGEIFKLIKILQNNLLEEKMAEQQMLEQQMLEQQMLEQQKLDRTINAEQQFDIL